MKRFYPTVTIGVPAFNEEGNIGNLLQALLKQKCKSFKLKNILIANDNSTDQTVKIVKSYMKKSKKIVLINDGKRLGKPTRLNQFYKMANADIFVAIDADIMITSRQYVESLVSRYKKPGVELVSANLTPISPKTFFEKVVCAWVEVWNDIRWNERYKDSVHNYLASASSMSKKLYKQIKLPSNVLADDTFIFTYAMKKGYAFSCVKGTKAYYKAPSNVSDYLKQMSRFLMAHKQLNKYFPKELDAELKISNYIKMKSILKVFVKKPVFLSIALLLQLISRLGKNILFKEHKKGFWTVIQSSKVIKPKFS